MSDSPANPNRSGAPSIAHFAMGGMYLPKPTQKPFRLSSPMGSDSVLLYFS
jgi:hypothetical protein